MQNRDISSGEFFAAKLMFSGPEVNDVLDPRHPYFGRE